MGLPQGELVNSGCKASLTDEIKTRVDTLREEGIITGLAILRANPDHKATDSYVRFKTEKARELGIVATPIAEYSAEGLLQWTDLYNRAPNVQGIIVQLPLLPRDAALTDTILNSVVPEKDVDGLRTDQASPYDPATPSGILHLLEGNGVDLAREPVAILGKGRLVGAPLLKMLLEKGATATAVDDTDSVEKRLNTLDEATVIISAMGVPHGLTSDLFSNPHQTRVLVDAGTAEQEGIVKGDVSDELRRHALEYGWGITPKFGGVGPLTILSLLANTVTAAETQAALIK